MSLASKPLKNERMMKPSHRSDVQPFLVMQALREAAQLDAEGADIIHLSLGQPANKPPQRVLDKVAEALKTEQLGYTDSRGVSPLRERLAHFYYTEYGHTVSPERIFVTTGSSSAQFLALLAAFDVGAKVAINTPCYAAYPQLMKSLGITPIFIPTNAETNYQPTVSMLRALEEKPDGIILTSPSNPTGTVISPDEYAAIIAHCDAEGIRVISDEIYHTILYGDAQVQTAISLSDQSIVTSSFSKYFLLPGWRLGWMIVPENFQIRIENLLQNFFLSAPAVAQIAALEALECRTELDEVVVQYTNNRQIVADGLRAAGLHKLSEPQGAFYIYADISDYSDDSIAFCQKMLREAHVCAVAGVDFDAQRGHHFVRFSYAGAPERMKEACERLKIWIGGLPTTR